MFIFCAEHLVGPVFEFVFIFLCYSNCVNICICCIVSMWNDIKHLLHPFSEVCGIKRKLYGNYR